MGGETRILGLVAGDPRTTLSQVAHRLFEAVDERFRVVERLDYGPHGARRLMLAARTFRASRDAWRARFNSSLVAHRTHERGLAAARSGLEHDFDFAIQVHGWVTGEPRPYALFVDQTRLMADRGWPGWIALPPGQRSTLLALEQKMYDQSRHVFVMGGATRESLIGDYGVEPDRITVVGGGPVFSRLPEASGPAAEPRVLFVGRDFERKGGQHLLRAFELVREQIPDARLDIVGVKRRTRAPGVVFHGQVADRDGLAALYRSARAFCLPSVYEPYGLVLLEAMAHGIPCVGARVQSIPEILDDGRAGVLVEPGATDELADALIALLRDDHLGSRLGAAGRSFVERELTWNRVVDRMSPVIERAGS